MNEQPTGRDLVPATSAHLPDQTLEQLAEGILPSAEAASARAHIEECGRCLAQLEGYQSLFAMLERLPRFAPSPVFADAVMARVAISPRESTVAAWLRRLVPTSRRGWALIGVAVTAPVTPILVLVAWLFTQPLLSPVTFWQWALLRAQSTSQATMAWLVDRAVGSSLFGSAETLYATMQTVPALALGTAIALFAIAIPLSGWGLLRLVRTPVGSVSYAN